MGDVTNLPKRGQWIHGPATCVRCKHSWEAVVPVGTVKDLECPCCHAKTGILNYVVEPDGMRWACRCDNQLFFLPPKGAPMCCNCGLRAQGWADS